jgi:hypothetical protein
MSGIKKTDRFTPVVTAVIYYGSDPWDGPVCLYDMLKLPENLKQFITNFRVNLVEARESTLVFHNQNNRDLFSLLKIICDNSTNRKEKRIEIENYEADRTIDKSVRLAIAATSKINLAKFEKEDATMCKLWDEIWEEGRTNGRAEGRTEGRAEGTIETLFSLVKDGILTLSEAASRVNMTEAVFKEQVKKIKI